MFLKHTIYIWACPFCSLSQMLPFFHHGRSFVDCGGFANGEGRIGGYCFVGELVHIFFYYMGRCQIDLYIQPAEIRDQLGRGSGHICKYKNI